MFLAPGLEREERRGVGERLRARTEMPTRASPARENWSRSLAERRPSRLGPRIGDRRLGAPPRPRLGEGTRQRFGEDKVRQAHMEAPKFLWQGGGGLGYGWTSHGAMVSGEGVCRPPPSHLSRETPGMLRDSASA